MAGKEVATQKEMPKGLASVEMLGRLEGLSGKGFENTTIEDFALPFLHVLQKMSPEVDKADPKYVKGAETGMFMDSVTQELFDGEKGLEVIAVDFQKVFNLWVPRNAGGGFKGSGRTREEATKIAADLEKQGFDKQLEIIDTANHYLLIRDNEGKLRAIVLSCTSTKLKASRAWMSVMARVTLGDKAAPSFAKKYTLKTVSQKNDKGTFSNIKADVIEGAAGWVNNEELDAALEFYKQLQSGKRGADFSTASDDVAKPVGEDEF